MSCQGAERGGRQAAVAAATRPGPAAARAAATSLSFVSPQASLGPPAALSRSGPALLAARIDDVTRQPAPPSRPGPGPGEGSSYSGPPHPNPGRPRAPARQTFREWIQKGKSIKYFRLLGTEINMKIERAK